MPTNKSSNYIPELSLGREKRQDVPEFENGGFYDL